MRLTHAAGRFETLCNFEERLIPKTAGFLYDGDRKRWWTDDPARAWQLHGYADEKALAALEPTRRSLQASRAQDVVVDPAALPAPLGRAYLPFQRTGIVYMLERPATLLADAMGLGKELPEITGVLTPRGWVTIGSLRAGDRVIGSRGRSIRVTGVYPQGVKPVFRVRFSDGSSVRAGAEHLWLMHHKSGHAPNHIKSVVLTTEQLRTRPVIERWWTGHGVTRLDLAKTTLILPMLSGPVQFAAARRPLPVGAYTLGTLIANGSCSGQGVALTVNHHDAIEVRARVAAEGTPINEGRARPGCVVFGVSVVVRNALRLLGLNVLSGDKFIPRSYLMASPEARRALLQGLMDCDGSITPTRNRLIYHTTSSRLADDVVELVEGLGGIASVRTYDRTSEGKSVEYQVRLRPPKWVEPFSVERKASRYKPGRLALPIRTVVDVTPDGEEESVCIAVDAPDKLYVTEHCILTHNTIQALGLINADQSIRRVLVVCPASLKLNWGIEAERWLTRRMSVGIAGGQEGIPPTDIVICNYDALGKLIGQGLDSIAWDCVILDECHYVKNPEAKRSKRALALLRGARKRLALTGTPIVNRPRELWPVLNALDGVAWAEKGKFMGRYCGLKTLRFGKKLIRTANGATNLDELQTRLRSTCMLRRLKSEVLTELPEKRRQTVVIPVDAEVQTLLQKEVALQSQYEQRREQLKQAKRDAQEKGGVETVQEALAGLEESERVAFEAISLIRHETAIAKIPYVIDYAKELLESEEKLIVFGHHRELIHQVGRALSKYQPVTLMGGMSLRDRQQAVTQFQEDPKCRVFMGSITAAGVGLTLTASSLVLMAELPWTPGELMQSEDRAHRIGQSREVLVQYLVLDGSLDAKFAKTIVEKADIIEQALDYDADQLGRSVDAEPRQALESATRGLTPKLIQAEAGRITRAQLDAIHEALGRAIARSEHWHKFDRMLARSLVDAKDLAPAQAVLGRRIVLRYAASTLPPPLVAALSA